ncbi:MAG: outer membrane beta-barrel protein [Pseudomonadota bacterium]
MRVPTGSVAAAVAFGGAAMLGAPAAFAAEDAYCFDKGTLSYRLCDAPAAPARSVYPTYDWTGVYFGLHAGYADADFSGAYDSGDAPTNTLRLSNLEPNDFVFGGQIGYDHQLGETYVVGFEIDASYFGADDDVKSSGLDVQDASAEINAFGSARLRGGLALDQFLPYITAGVGLIDYEATITDTSAGERATDNDLLIAPVIGGGLEVKLFRDVSMRAEALYYIIDSSESLGGLSDAEDGDKLVAEDLWTVRGGVNYRF